MNKEADSSLSEISDEDNKITSERNEKQQVLVENLAANHCQSSESEVSLNNENEQQLTRNRKRTVNSLSTECLKLLNINLIPATVNLNDNPSTAEKVNLLINRDELKERIHHFRETRNSSVRKQQIPDNLNVGTSDRNVIQIKNEIKLFNNFLSAESISILNKYCSNLNFSKIIKIPKPVEVPFCKLKPFSQIKRNGQVFKFNENRFGNPFRPMGMDVNGNYIPYEYAVQANNSVAHNRRINYAYQSHNVDRHHKQVESVNVPKCSTETSVERGPLQNLPYKNRFQQEQPVQSRRPPLTSNPNQESFDNSIQIENDNAFDTLPSDQEMFDITAINNEDTLPSSNTNQNIHGTSKFSYTENQNADSLLPVNPSSQPISNRGSIIIDKADCYIFDKSMKGKRPIFYDRQSQNATSQPAVNASARINDFQLLETSRNLANHDNSTSSNRIVTESIDDQNELPLQINRNDNSRRRNYLKSSPSDVETIQPQFALCESSLSSPTRQHHPPPLHFTQQRQNDDRRQDVDNEASSFNPDTDATSSRDILNTLYKDTDPSDDNNDDERHAS